MFFRSNNERCLTFNGENNRKTLKLNHVHILFSEQQGLSSLCYELDTGCILLQTIHIRCLASLMK